MSTADTELLKYETYDDYCDAYSLLADKRYCPDDKTRRFLIKIGYRTTFAPHTEQIFEEKKAAAYASLSGLGAKLFSDGMTSEDPVLIELAKREQLNINKTISTIIFLKERNPVTGFDISGYIDYEESLRHASLKLGGCTNWSGIFQEKALLRPTSSNLSFYDWKGDNSKYNNSDNFIVKFDVKNGLIFMHRKDGKKICVNSSDKKYAMNSFSNIYYSKVYGYVNIYDHIVRRKV